METMSRGTDEQLGQSTVAGKNEIVLACDGTNHKDHSGFCGAEDKHKITQRHEQNRHWLTCLSLRVHSQQELHYHS